MFRRGGICLLSYQFWPFLRFFYWIVVEMFRRGGICLLAYQFCPFLRFFYVVKNNHQPFASHCQTLSHNVVSILLVDGYGCGDYRHFQQYFIHILAISFIGGGNRSTRSHWQPVSHSGVSVILVEQELIICIISSPVVSWVHVVRSWVFFELRLLITSLESSTFSVSLSLQFSVCCFMDHWFLFCIL